MSVVVGLCLGLHIEIWSLYPMFAVLQPVVGGLYLSGLREQKRGTAHSQPWPEQDHS